MRYLGTGSIPQAYSITKMDVALGFPSPMPWTEKIVAFSRLITTVCVMGSHN